jgi:hypothetical protein
MDPLVKKNKAKYHTATKHHGATWSNILPAPFVGSFTQSCLDKREEARTFADKGVRKK